nr:uncharacterized protein LOC109151883 [Ipomoea batatas]
MVKPFGASLRVGSRRAIPSAGQRWFAPETTAERSLWKGPVVVESDVAKGESPLSENVTSSMIVSRNSVNERGGPVTEPGLVNLDGAVPITKGLPPLLGLDNFAAWFSKLVDGKDEVLIRSCVALCWAIWNCRNELLWNNKSWSPGEVMRRAALVLEEWGDLQSSNLAATWLLSRYVTAKKLR